MLTTLCLLGLAAFQQSVTSASVPIDTILPIYGEQGLQIPAMRGVWRATGYGMVMIHTGVRGFLH